jgi:hypothetical protein
MAFSLGRPTNQGAIPSYGDLIQMFALGDPQYATVASAGTTDTLTGFQINAGIFVRSGATAAVAVTTDTAANIISAAGSNVAVGQTFMLIYANLNTSSGAVTVSGGTGVTTSGTMTIPIAGLRLFIITVTALGATPTCTIQGAFSISANVAA